MKQVGFVILFFLIGCGKHPIGNVPQQTPSAATVPSGSGAHGGDEEVGQFRTIGREIADWIRNNPSKLPKIDVDKFLKTVNSADIRCTEDPKQVTIVEPSSNSSVQKEAVSYPSEQKTILYRPWWSATSDVHRKWLIVSHEIFLLMGLEDSKNEISSLIDPIVYEEIELGRRAAENFAILYGSYPGSVVASQCRKTAQKNIFSCSFTYSEMFTSQLSKLTVFAGRELKRLPDGTTHERLDFMSWAAKPSAGFKSMNISIDDKRALQTRVRAFYRFLTRTSDLSTDEMSCKKESETVLACEYLGHDDEVLNLDNDTLHVKFQLKDGKVVQPLSYNFEAGC